MEFLCAVKVSCHQLKLRCYILCKPQNNHKGKTCSKHTQNYDKRIKAYHQKTSSNQKGRQWERTEVTKELQSSQKKLPKMAIVSPYLSITIEV